MFFSSGHPSTCLAWFSEEIGLDFGVYLGDSRFLAASNVIVEEGGDVHG